MKTHNISTHHNQKGQVLLIIIMLLATFITVVTTVSFKSTTETQISKLEEESQKTLAAAEAGIEKAIGDRLSDTATPLSFSGLNLSNLSGIDQSGSTVAVSSQTTTSFVTPLLQKDQQYTFYLASYDVVTNAFSNPYAGTIRIGYGNEISCSTLALEITLVSGNGPYTIRRYISDQGNILTSNTDDLYTSGSTTIDGVLFNCRTNTINITAASNPKLLIVRSIGNKTRLGLLGNATLRPQGKFIVSEAKSASGVVKKIQLFQSFPQIPAEFFVSTL